MSTDYVFVSRWVVARTRESLWDTLEQLLATDDPMVWWPSVSVERYDGDTMNVRASSAFGYSLRFCLADLASQRPEELTFTATGDLKGDGMVRFADEPGGNCSMTIDWRVSTDRRWMRVTGRVLRPVFVAGHALIMRQGHRHLNAWLRTH